MQQTEMDAEEKDRLMNELNAKEEVQQKEKAKKSKLLKKIKGMEEKLLHGSEAMEEAMKAVAPKEPGSNNCNNIRKHMSASKNTVSNQLALVPLRKCGN